MAKLKTVTSAEIDAAIQSGEDCLMSMHDIISRLEKGYVDRIEAPAAKIRALTSMARAAAELANKVAVAMELDEMKAETEALIRQRLAQ